MLIQGIEGQFRPVVFFFPDISSQKRGESVEQNSKIFQCQKLKKNGEKPDPSNFEKVSSDSATITADFRGLLYDRALISFSFLSLARIWAEFARERPACHKFVISKIIGLFLIKLLDNKIKFEDRN